MVSLFLFVSLSYHLFFRDIPSSCSFFPEETTFFIECHDLKRLDSYLVESGIGGSSPVSSVLSTQAGTGFHSYLSHLPFLLIRDLTQEILNVSFGLWPMNIQQSDGMIIFQVQDRDYFLSLLKPYLQETDEFLYEDGRLFALSLGSGISPLSLGTFDNYILIAPLSATLHRAWRCWTGKRSSLGDNAKWFVSGDEGDIRVFFHEFPQSGQSSEYSTFSTGSLSFHCDDRLLSGFFPFDPQRDPLKVVDLAGVKILASYLPACTTSFSVGIPSFFASGSDRLISSKYTSLLSSTPSLGFILTGAGKSISASLLLAKGENHRLLSAVTQLAQERGGALRTVVIEGRDCLYASVGSGESLDDAFCVCFLSDVMVLANSRNELEYLLKMINSGETCKDASLFIDFLIEHDIAGYGYFWYNLSQLFTLATTQEAQGGRPVFLGGNISESERPGYLEVTSSRFVGSSADDGSSGSVLRIVGMILIAPILLILSLLAAFILLMFVLCIFYMVRSKRNRTVYEKTVPDPATISNAMRSALNMDQ